MNIGQAAVTTGMSAQRLRYYEQIGLLGRAKRSAAGYGVFDRDSLHTLSFIRRAVPGIRVAVEPDDYGRSNEPEFGFGD